MKLSCTQAERCACHRFTNLPATSSSPGESCAFVLRRLKIGGCCVAVSQVRSKCVTVLRMSLLREDRGVNSRVFFVVCEDDPCLTSQRIQTVCMRRLEFVY